MARFMVKAGEFKNVCKAVNDRKLAELKKEIIEILKKQDENEVKKAVDYFNSQEFHYKHLEKSLVSGKWIEKAGYGVGTVRIWKGKKYKKIAPGKWARVFEKESRGTNIAIGKLIAKVNKIDNVEDLMAFVMANKQRFVDENGVDLPVLDKLRSAVDAKNNGAMGNPDYPFKPKTEKERAERTAFEKDRDEFIERMDKIRQENNKKSEKKNIQGVKILSKDEIHNLTKGEVQDYRKELHDAMKKLDYGDDDFDILYATKKIADDTWNNKEYKGAVDSDKNIKEFSKFLKENNLHQHDKIEYKGKKYVIDYDSQDGDGDLLWIPPVFDDSEFDVKEITIKTKDKEDVDPRTGKENYWIIDSHGNRLTNKDAIKRIQGNLAKIDELENSDEPRKDMKIKDLKFDNEYLRDRLNFDDRKEIESEYEKSGKVEDYKKQIQDVVKEELVNQKEDVARYYEIKQRGLSGKHAEGLSLTKKDKETSIDDRIQEAAEWLVDHPQGNPKSIGKMLARIELAKEFEKNPNWRYGESEEEKRQNRSEAMKGNKNAYKGGHEDEPVHNKVAKNGIYYTFDGFSHGLNRSFRQAKDLPQNIKDNINNSVNRYLDYVDNWADKGYKKVANDMIKNPEKYQHMSLEEFNKETGYDKSDVSEIVSLKTKIEFAEKLRDFNLEESMISKDAEQNFSRDEIYPVSLKQNIEEGFLPNQIADIEREKAEKAEKKEKVAKKPSGKLPSTNPEKLKPIATNEKIADGKVKMPYSKELSDEIKQLVGTLDSKKKNPHPREFFTKVYYDNGNLIATDSHALKIVKVGELDGIPNGSYVDIENTKDGVTLTRDKEFSENYKFANYNRIIPDNNKEKIVLDNKALLSKVKELKKDGGIVGKDSYVTFDIKGNDLMLDGVKVGDVSAANFEGEGSDYFNMDVNLLTPYLSGDTTDLISSTDNEKAMYIGNDSAINIIMPQNKWDKKVDSNGNWVKEERRKNYENQRAAKAYEEETKANQKAAKKQSNQEFVNYMIDRVKESVNKPDFAERMIAKLPDWTTEQLQRLHKQAMADVDHLMETKDFNANSFMTFTDKNFGVMPRVFIGQNYAMKQHPEIVKEVERLLEERGAKIEKSLFDGFLGLELLEEDIDDIEEEKEEESLWNDYSAEQPELFNSIELQVREAMNRHYSNSL